MEAIEKLLNTQITILVLILVGYILSKKKIVDAAFRKAMTDFIINFILPCNIIKSFMMEFNGEILSGCLAVCVVSAITQVVTFLLGKLLFGRKDDAKRAVLEYATMVSNAGFLGNPIVEGLYGAQGLLYASIYLIPQRIMMWSAGVTCFTGSKGRGVLRKVLTHPCIIAVGCNTALSLIVIGGILAEVDPRSIISRDSLFFCLIRLVLIPLPVLAGSYLSGLDQVVVGSSTVLAGMPAPLTVAILASQHDKNEKFAVSLVFLSTVCSMVTIPLLCLLMMAVY